MAPVGQGATAPVKTSEVPDDRVPGIGSVVFPDADDPAEAADAVIRSLEEMALATSQARLYSGFLRRLRFSCSRDSEVDSRDLSVRSPEASRRSQSDDEGDLHRRRSGRRKRSFSG